MSYTVTYRNKDGRQEAIQLDAESRAALFAELSKRGISAVRVEESKGKAKKAKQYKAAAAPRKPSPFRSLFAGIVVIALAVAAWYYLLPTIEQVKTKREKKTSRIAEATPEIAEQTAVEEAPKEEPVKPLGPQKAGEVRNGMRMLSSGRLIPVSKTTVTSGVARVTLVEKTFKCGTDRQLAYLLEIEPGEGLVGDSSFYYANFKEDFLKSLDEPIIYDKEDEPYVKELKAGVSALRQEIKERIAEGEDVEQLLIETRNQMQELGLYRKELEDQVLQLSQDGDMSQEDYEDLVKAANLMLEERGSKPLELPSVLRHSMRFGVK